MVGIKIHRKKLINHKGGGFLWQFLVLNICAVIVEPELAEVQILEDPRQVFA